MKSTAAQPVGLRRPKRAPHRLHRRPRTAQLGAHHAHLTRRQRPFSPFWAQLVPKWAFALYVWAPQRAQLGFKRSTCCRHKAQLGRGAQGGRPFPSTKTGRGCPGEITEAPLRYNWASIEALLVSGAPNRSQRCAASEPKRVARPAQLGARQPQAAAPEAQFQLS